MGKSLMSLLLFLTELQETNINLVENRCCEITIAVLPTVFLIIKKSSENTFDFKVQLDQTF